MPAAADVFVEVTQIDAVREAALSWFRSHNQDSVLPISEVTETNWKSRIFTITPVAGHSFAFWEWADPLKGKPVAIEGDLSAAGMRFAIVVARWNAVITERLLGGRARCAAAQRRGADGSYRNGARARCMGSA